MGDRYKEAGNVSDEDGPASSLEATKPPGGAAGEKAEKLRKGGTDREKAGQPLHKFDNIL